jgi:hypothetical protein
MKLSPFVIGVISAQGSGDYDYGADDDRHTGYYGGGSSSSYGGSSWNYGASSGRMATHATAVTCWESNNMGSHATHHQHMYDQQDEYGWANTHFGHKTSVGTVNVVNNVEHISLGGAVDYHSALAFDHRLSGCIYEISGWDFTASTYNKKHGMTFGSTVAGVGYDTSNGNIYPVWWHYFNAHVMPGGSTGAHDIVMANPTYEGLGYLNFIVTFLAGDGSSGTAERNPESNDNNLNDGSHTDLYANGDSFALTIDSTTPCGTYSDIGSGTRCYASKYVQNDGDTDDWTFLQMSISSFPHNDLGKDFRFNLRMMHHLGEGDSHEFFDSYYFYRVNTITINFPTVVSCPYEVGHDGGVVVHKCMDSAGHNGHRTGLMATFMETMTDHGGQSGTDFPAACTGTPTVGMHSCGDEYSVMGLMNMYDEYAQQEYGTHQELWFQFHYKYVHQQNTVGGEVGEDQTAVYNYPNKLFNAFEVVSVGGGCDITNLMNGNRCNGGAGDGVGEENWSENVQSGK